VCLLFIRVHAGGTFTTLLLLLPLLLPVLVPLAPLLALLLPVLLLPIPQRRQALHVVHKPPRSNPALAG
jgi:hypothetical protein